MMCGIRMILKKKNIKNTFFKTITQNLGVRHFLSKDLSFKLSYGDNIDIVSIPEPEQSDQRWYRVPLTGYTRYSTLLTSSITVWR